MDISPVLGAHHEAFTDRHFMVIELLDIARQRGLLSHASTNHLAYEASAIAFYIYADERGMQYTERIQ